MAGAPAELTVHILKNTAAQHQAVPGALSFDKPKVINLGQLHRIEGPVPCHQNRSLVRNPVALTQHIIALHDGRHHQQRRDQDDHPGGLDAPILIASNVQHQNRAGRCHRADPLPQDLPFGIVVQQWKILRFSLPAHLFTIPQIRLQHLFRRLLFLHLYQLLYKVPALLRLFFIIAGKAVQLLTSPFRLSLSLCQVFSGNLTHHLI